MNLNTSSSSPWKVKSKPFSGSSYKEVKRAAWRYFLSFKATTKRKPYIRAAYFSHQKIFFDFFWEHVAQKFSHKDKIRRLRFLACAVELIKYSQTPPVSTEHSKINSQEIYYRFQGKTSNQIIFYVQIKENTRRGRKFLMSVFPK